MISPRPNVTIDGEVREGIKHMLELDHYDEEIKRLQKKQSAIQSWIQAQ